MLKGKEKEWVVNQGGREGGLWTASVGKKQVAMDEKREKWMFGAQETHSKMQRHAEHC